MGECCTPDEEDCYKIGEEVIIVSKYGHCDNCGTAHVQIHKYTNEFENEDFVKLGSFDPDEEGEHIVINASDFFDTIKSKLKDAFGDDEKDELNLNEYDNFKKFIRLFGEKLRESDNEIKEGWNCPTYNEKFEYSKRGEEC